MTSTLEKAQFQPYLYAFDVDALGGRTAIRYSMPFRAYETLKKVQGIQARFNAHIGGLAAVLGWAAPAVDLIKFESVEKGNYNKTLCFWMIDSSYSPDELKKQVEIALEIWLAVTLPPDACARVQEILGDGRFSAGGKCDTFNISTAIKSGGSCARPADSNMYSLLTLYAARLLEGASINDGTSDEGQLISSGAQNDLYAGKSLLRYRPSEIERGRKLGLWSETFNVVALNTPEQQDLRIAVNIGIRNFGPLAPAALSWRQSRYLDVFLPSDFSLSPNAQRMRCVELEIRKGDFGDDSLDATRVSQDRKVLMKLLEMSGARAIPRDIGLAPFDLNDFGMFPRLGAYHGDRYAMAGTGIPSSERESYLRFLDQQLLNAGFRRIQFNAQRSPQTRLLRAVNTPEQLRTAVTHATGSLDYGGGLRVAHFVDGDASSGFVKEALAALFGKPVSAAVHGSRTRLRYEDGFSLDWHQVSAGPMAEKVPAIDEEELSELKASGNWAMYGAAVRDLWHKAGMGAAKLISAHVETARVSDGASWAALVEIPDHRGEDARRDPFLLNYAALARHGAVAQTKLVSIVEDGNEEDVERHKKVQCLTFENALRDLLRSAGVSPVFSDALRLAGWWMLNRNDKRFDKRPGELDGLVTPLYAECLRGQLRVCVLNTREEPEWLDYAEALRRVVLRQVFDLSKLGQAEQSVRAEQFFAGATPADGVPTVVFAEATNIRRFVKGLGNEGLEFDSIRLGAIGGAAALRTITSGGDVSVVRITNETTKAPCYFVGGRKLGYSKGLFQEIGSKNVFWLNRGLSTALHLGHQWANIVSRQGEAHTKKFAHRRFPSLGEVAVVVKGKDMKANQLAGITRKAMHLHLATDEETLLPFPLHELSKLK